MTAQEGVDDRKARAATQAAIEAEQRKFERDMAIEEYRAGNKQPEYVQVDMADGSKAWVQKPGTGPRQAETRNTPAADAGFKVFRDAIAGIESAGAGDYAAVGPQTKTGDRAYGRYQVMGANIPEWTKAALGHSMTPEQFAASPEAQDAVFDHRFGGYVRKYGPEGAARAWFAGEGGMNNDGARDSLGTSVADYAGKFSRNMGGMNEQYTDTASGGMSGVIPIPGSGRPKEEKPSSIQQRQRDLRELQASGQRITQGMAQYYMLHGKFQDAPEGAGGKPAKGMTGDVANKVGLYNNALRSAREWHDIVAEKGPDGRPTGGYNNMAAMSP